ncbi:C40 family peptidase [Neolewinella persica]|uniref:C40 family peptidase n=1 Tax=Neolewinella persica TaxID=70998 RepID=UPI000379467A|nr:C40 family peptidase [Neolewinella persica]
MKNATLLLSFCSLLLLNSCGVFKPADSTTSRRPTTGRAGSGSATSYIRADITAHASELLGLKYKFGGNNPRQGFDCSGFVLYLYQNAGIDIERVSRDQAKQGKEIPLSRAKPGDLVFYKRPGKPVFHVSVIVEAGVNKLVVIHATNSGVIRENVLESKYWEPKIYQVRDILN